MVKIGFCHLPYSWSHISLKTRKHKNLMYQILYYQHKIWWLDENLNSKLKKKTHAQKSWLVKSHKKENNSNKDWAQSSSLQTMSHLIRIIVLWPKSYLIYCYIKTPCHTPQTNPNQVQLRSSNRKIKYDH
jgi:hypothetical protein